MGINQRRLEIIMKGYATRNDIRFFCKVGSQRANQIYDEIVEEVISEGKTVNKLGISPIRLANYIGLTESKIIKYAEMEREYEKN